MKKKLGVIILAIVMTMGLMSGCGEKAEEEMPYDYDLSEYISIMDYHNMPYVKQIAEITDADVEQAINNRLQYAATIENSLAGVVEDGDTINIAFEGRIDGELFDGGSSESYDLTVGTTSMIEGFVEGLIGKKVGETVILDLKFPDEYHSAEVAGKPVVFEVTINSKKTVTVPEFNDEFVQANSEFTTTDEYRENLRQVLTKQAQDNLDVTVKDALWEIILNGTEVIKYPEEEMKQANAAADAMEAEYKEEAALYGWEWADYLKLFMGTDEEGFVQMKEEYAQSKVISEMVLYKMSRDENVTISQAEFEERTKQILDASSFTEETFKSSFGMTIFEYAEANGWRESFLMEKVLDKVIEYGREVSEEEFDEFLHENGYEHDHDHDHDHDHEEDEDHDHEEDHDDEDEGEGEGESESGSNG